MVKPVDVTFNVLVISTVRTLVTSTVRTYCTVSTITEYFFFFLNGRRRKKKSAIDTVCKWDIFFPRMEIIL